MSEFANLFENPKLVVTSTQPATPSPNCSGRGRFWRWSHECCQNMHAAVER